MSPHSNQHATQSTSFHVYRSKSIFSHTKTMTGPDKRTILYYLDSPMTFNDKWNYTLTRGKGGPIVCKIKKGISWTFGKDPKTIKMANGWETTLKKESALGRDHVFHDPNGTTFRWEVSKNGKHNAIPCINLSTGQVVATWRSCLFSISKEGELVVYSANPEIDLLAATGLAIDEYLSGQRRQKSRAAGVTAAGAAL